MSTSSQAVADPIKIDYTRDSLFDTTGLLRLKDSYMTAEEKSPQERLAYVSQQFASNAEHAQRLYDYSSKHWLSYSTPILAFGKDKRGLPISCFLPYLPDSREGLVNTLAEANWLSMLGGGVGIGIGIRSSGNKSTGVMSHMKTYDAASLAYRQGTTRRGSYAMYLDINHPDLMMFLDMRKPTGDTNQRCLNLHHGINITDDFMKIIQKCMIEADYDDSWPLIDPYTKKTTEVVSAKHVWQKIIELRMHTGEPYIHFIDTTNRELPQHLKNKGLFVRQSNLCSEILEPTNDERTAVCCLSSLNLERYDEWRGNERFISDVAEMLDNVLTYFIDNAPTAISRAIFSASQERSIGIGALGFHALLQQKGIPFESAMAKSLNIQIFKYIQMQVNIANLRLGAERGEAPDAIGTGKRMSLTMAIAPNASSSIIMGNTSPSIEPYRANAYRQDTISGSHLNKNHYLDKLIRSYCEKDSILNYDEIWSSIISNDGSAQHLEFLTDWERDTFKTAMEIDQRWIIEHAATRQEYIDQGQSLNLFFLPDVNITYLHAVHYEAWQKGVKTLYYCRSEKIGKADKLDKKIVRSRIEDINIEKMATETECLACQ